MAHIHSVYDNDVHFKIDAVTRSVRNVSEVKAAVVQKSKNSERFTFELPRTIEGHDMSTCNKVEVHFTNTDAKDKAKFNTGIYTVDDLQVCPENEDIVICSWLIDEDATQFAGKLAFSVLYICYSGDEFNPEYVFDTVEYTNVFVSPSINHGVWIRHDAPPNKPGVPPSSTHTDCVKTVNGFYPDENGNVQIEFLGDVEIPGGPDLSGPPGEDGFSPTATVTQTDEGAVISITDKNGTTTATIENGAPGIVWKGEWDRNTTYSKGDVVYYEGSSYIYAHDEPAQSIYDPIVDASWMGLAIRGETGLPGHQGEDGFSPKVVLKENEDGVVINVTTKEGNPESMLVQHGFSPTVTVARSDEHQVVLQLENKDNTEFAYIYHGEDGFSPVVAVEETDVGVNLSVVDKQHGSQFVPLYHGKDGTSATHSWNGTVLSVTSASGTSSVDLKGAKGDPGEDGNGIKSAVLNGDYTLTLTFDDGTTYTTPSIRGATGETGETGRRGPGLLPITTAPSSYSTAVNGLTPAYRITLSTVKTQASTTEVFAGDTLRYSYYHYPIIYVDTSYVYCGARVSIRGSTGAAGTTPVKGTDYYTAADKAEMVNAVIAALPVYTGEVV